MPVGEKSPVHSSSVAEGSLASALVVVMISVVVAVVVTPGPVFFLLTGRKLAELAMGIAMGFISPAIVVNNFVVVPDVIVGVVRIVNPVGMMLAGNSGQGRSQRRRQQQRTQGVRTTAHVFLLRSKKTLLAVISCWKLACGFRIMKILEEC